MPVFFPVNSVYSKSSSKWIQREVFLESLEKLLRRRKMCISCGYFIKRRYIEKFTQMYIEYLGCRTIIFLIDIKNKINRSILMLLLTESL